MLITVTSASATVVEEYSPAAISTNCLSTAVATPYLNDNSVSDTTTAALAVGNPSIYSTAITGIYDLGAPVSVGKIEVYSSINGGGGGGNFYYSTNGVNWNTAPMGPAFSGNLIYSGALSSTVTARYWAYSCSGGGGPSVSSQISDFRVFDVNGNELDLGPTVPGAPTALTASGSSTSITLHWTAPSGTVNSYSIYRGITSGGESPTSIASNITTTSYTDSPLPSGQIYFYFVKGLNTVGFGPSSNEASDSTHPPDFSISDSSINQTLHLGGNVTSTVTISDLSGFNGSVALNVSNLPSGVSGVFTPSTTSSTASFVLSATPTATTGTSTITISGTGSSGTHTANITLIVAPVTSVVQEYVPTSLSTTTLSSATPTAYLNDKTVGDTSTYVSGAGLASATVTGIYDLGTSSPPSVAKVEIEAMIVGGGGGGSFYYSSDGINWNPAPMGQGFTGNLIYTGLLGSAVTARYWAYSASGGGPPSGVTAEISDFRLYDNNGNEIDHVPGSPAFLTATGTQSSINLAIIYLTQMAIN